MASFATTTHCLPSTTPIPVTIPADGACAVVQLPGGERAQLEECGARIDEEVDPLSGCQLPPRAVALDSLVAAALRDESRALAQFRDERLHPLAPRSERLGVAIHLRGQHYH